jgi:hypothetical protein
VCFFFLPRALFPLLSDTNVITLRLATGFAYCPVVRPPQFSPLRRAAYERGGSDIPGPDADPDGWTVIPTVAVEGTIFFDRGVKVDAQLALANPVCYEPFTLVACMLLTKKCSCATREVLLSHSALL